MFKESWLFLAFHCIVKPDDPRVNHSLSCTEDRFRMIIRHLKAAGYEFMTCTQFAAAFGSGEAKDRKIAVLSFDDGYLDNWLAAQIMIEEGVVGTFFPIACTLGGCLPISRLVDFAAKQELGFKAWFNEARNGRYLHGGFRPTPFPSTTLAGQGKGFLACSVPLPEVCGFAEDLCSRFLNGLDKRAECEKAYLAPDQLRCLAEKGMEVGNHTFWHCRLDGQTPKDIAAEIELADRALNELAGLVTHSVALPYGGAQSASLWCAMGNFPQRSWWNYHEFQEPKTLFTVEGGTPLFERMDQRFFKI